MDRPKRPSPLPHNVLQDYLEALAEPGNGPNDRQRRVLLSYAELQYQLHGGGRCAVCHSAVRHVLPVRAEHSDGSVADHDCLCTRCLEAEKSISRRITLRIGTASLHYICRPPDAPPTTKSFRHSG